MTHAVATAVIYAESNYNNGFVFCTCGKRFGLYHEDDLVKHIKEENARDQA